MYFHFSPSMGLIQSNSWRVNNQTFSAGHHGWHWRPDWISLFRQTKCLSELMAFTIDSASSVICTLMIPQLCSTNTKAQTVRRFRRVLQAVGPQRSRSSDAFVLKHEQKPFFSAPEHFGSVKWLDWTLETLFSSFFHQFVGCPWILRCYIYTQCFTPKRITIHPWALTDVLNIFLAPKTFAKPLLLLLFAG